MRVLPRSEAACERPKRRVSARRGTPLQCAQEPRPLGAAKRRACTMLLGDAEARGRGCQCRAGMMLSQESECWCAHRAGATQSERAARCQRPEAACRRRAWRWLGAARRESVSLARVACGADEVGALTAKTFNNSDHPSLSTFEKAKKVVCFSLRDTRSVPWAPTLAVSAAVLAPPLAALRLAAHVLRVT
eukprot:1207608-Rhodomonas_salina.1